MDEEKDRLRGAYRAAGRVLRRTLRPDEQAELDQVATGEVVIVSGEYDHIRRVFEATQIPFTEVAPADVHRLDFERLEVLLINCPGHLASRGLEAIGAWVRRGGYLLTTDWALKHVLEPLFPNTVRHNGRQTDDRVVRVETEAAVDDPLLSGLLEAERDPLWWLEGASYPIEVLDKEKVKVLIRSAEVGRLWGADPVAVTFDEGQGTVTHLMSHLYLQRSEVRDQADARPAAAYAMSLGLSDAEAEEALREAPGVNLSDLKSAYSTSRLLSKAVLAAKRKRAKGPLDRN
jgi:hypothetical protein